MSEGNEHRGRTPQKKGGSSITMILVILIAVIGGAVYMVMQKRAADVPSRPKEPFPGMINTEEPAAGPETEEPAIAEAEVTPEVDPKELAATEEAAGIVDNVTRTEIYSWEKPHAKVQPDGNLKWASKPFVFEKGSSVRYIDFKAGNDSKDGKTKATAWKHHPWDAAAAGTAKFCKGAHTYVFKGGVEYKGSLGVKESGTRDDPIRLTSDPEWGEGKAVFSGSTTIKGGWQKATAGAAPAPPESRVRSPGSPCRPAPSPHTPPTRAPRRPVVAPRRRVPCRCPRPREDRSDHPSRRRSGRGLRRGRWRWRDP